MPSRLLTEILALVPDDFADPSADYRAVRAMLVPFHGHPVPSHVTVTDGELGGVRCAWYEDSRQPPRERVVFHCHGGGLVSCPLECFRTPWILVHQVMRVIEEIRAFLRSQMVGVLPGLFLTWGHFC